MLLNDTMQILQLHPVRKTGKQKDAFLKDVQEYASWMGYPVSAEKGHFGLKNLVLGDPEKAEYLVTAHYDTCARMPFPNLITPCNFWGFLLYQLLITALILMVALVIGFGIQFITGLQIGKWLSYIAVWALLGLMLFGPANPSNVNDNTSGVIALMEIARTLPKNCRHKVCFVLFDLEEAGLLGSAAYRKAHKTASNQQIVLNLDCVGEGDHLMMFPTAKLKKDKKRLTGLYRACGYFGKKSLLVREKGFSVYPSDQANFPYGVGICALKINKFGLYLGKIHTAKDTVLEETNINILRAALTTYMCCDS